jgi:hypothetical protein
VPSNAATGWVDDVAGCDDGVVGHGENVGTMDLRSLASVGWIWSATVVVAGREERVPGAEPRSMEAIEQLLKAAHSTTAAGILQREPSR